MTDVHTWIKTLPDIIKSYWVLIPMVLTTFSGVFTGGYHYFDKQEVMKKADIELEASLEQTAVVAEHLGKYVPKPVKTVYKTNCNSCKTLWLQDIEIGTKNHIKKSH